MEFLFLILLFFVASAVSVIPITIARDTNNMGIAIYLCPILFFTILIWGAKKLREHREARLKKKFEVEAKARQEAQQKAQELQFQKV